MKKSIIFYFLFISIGILLLYIQSCKREDNIDNYIIAKDNEFVTGDEAIQIASDINKSPIVLGSVDRSLLKSEKYIGLRQVHDSLIISDKQKVTYFYVFNYTTGGYAIISADRRLFPVLAYIDNGYFKKDSLPSGLIRWMETTAQIIKTLRNTNAVQSTAVAQEYAALSCPPTNQKSANSTCPNPTPVTYQKGPYLQTTWDQGCGYNTYCPVVDKPIICNHAYTGCVATAMAQVMAYWNYPLTYNWSQMPASNGSSETARLMYDIGKSVGMSYSASGSGASSTNICGALKNTFKYSSATYSNYNSSTVQHWLLYGPVLLGGCNNQSTILGIPYLYLNCHEWVCDGYQSTQIGNVTYLMFDMNWGWSGQFNGWYAFDNWATPNGYNFQYADDMVYNIHP